MVAFSTTRSAVTAAGRLTASSANNARIRSMEDSIAPPAFGAGSLEMPAWKSLVSGAAAILLGFAFIVAGTYKITDPYGMATRLIQMKVWPDVSLAAALLL